MSDDFCIVCAEYRVPSGCGCNRMYNELEEECDKYKEALELITSYGCTGEDARDMREIAINVLTEGRK